MQNDEVWMRLALQEARLAAAEGEIPVGAVLVRDGQEICRAHNLRENQHDLLIVIHFVQLSQV